MEALESKTGWAGYSQLGSWDGAVDRQGTVSRSGMGGEGQDRKAVTVWGWGWDRATILSLHDPATDAGSIGSSCAWLLSLELAPVTRTCRKQIAALPWTQPYAALHCIWFVLWLLTAQQCKAATMDHDQPDLGRGQSDVSDPAPAAPGPAEVCVGSPGTVQRCSEQPDLIMVHWGCPMLLGHEQSWHKPGAV